MKRRLSTQQAIREQLPTKSLLKAWITHEIRIYCSIFVITGDLKQANIVTIYKSCYCSSSHHEVQEILTFDENIRGFRRPIVSVANIILNRGWL